jgi:hypothetical protein
MPPTSPFPVTSTITCASPCWASREVPRFAPRPTSARPSARYSCSAPSPRSTTLPKAWQVT